MRGGFGTDSFKVRPRRKKFRVGFAVVKMEMGICFGSVHFSHSACVGELPEFVSLVSLDRSNWPRLSFIAWLVAWSSSSW